MFSGSYATEDGMSGWEPGKLDRRAGSLCSGVRFHTIGESLLVPRNHLGYDASQTKDLGRPVGFRGGLSIHHLVPAILRVGSDEASALGGKTMKADVFGARGTLATTDGPVTIYRLGTLQKAGLAPGLDRMPFSIKILLEAVLRSVDGELVTESDVRNLARWNAPAPADTEVPYMPARVVLQDFTGVPAVVDLAAMRAAVARAGGVPRRINPLVPADLVIDHSVQVDFFA